MKKLADQITNLISANKHISNIDMYEANKTVNVLVTRDFFYENYPDRIFKREGEHEIDSLYPYQLELTQISNDYKVIFKANLTKQEYEDWSRKFNKGAWQDESAR